MRPRGERNWDFYNDFSFTPKELFELKDAQAIGIRKVLPTYYGADTIVELCGQIFTYFIYLVILDIIENNVTFELPLFSKQRAYMFVKCIQGEELKRAVANGAFIGTDFIKTDFKAYYLVYQRICGRSIYEKKIYISCNLKQWFYSKINSGKQYY